MEYTQDKIFYHIHQILPNASPWERCHSFPTRVKLFDLAMVFNDSRPTPSQWVWVFMVKLIRRSSSCRLSSAFSLLNFSRANISCGSFLVILLIFMRPPSCSISAILLERGADCCHEIRKIIRLIPMIPIESQINA